jgi:hypothetical protein
MVFAGPYGIERSGEGPEELLVRSHVGPEVDRGTGGSNAVRQELELEGLFFRAGLGGPMHDAHGDATALHRLEAQPEHLLPVARIVVGELRDVEDLLAPFLERVVVRDARGEVLLGSPENVRAMKFGLGTESAVRMASNGRSMFPSNPTWLVGEACPFVSP